MGGLFSAIKGDVKAHLKPSGTSADMIFGPGLNRIINPKPKAARRVARKATVLSGGGTKAGTSLGVASGQDEL